MGLPWQTIKKPKELQQASKKSLFELQQAANEVLKEDYSKEDVAKILGMEVRLPASLFSLCFLLYSPILSSLIVCNFLCRWTNSDNRFLN